MMLYQDTLNVDVLHCHSLLFSKNSSTVSLPENVRYIFSFCTAKKLLVNCGFSGINNLFYIRAFYNNLQLWLLGVASPDNKDALEGINLEKRMKNPP